MSSMMLMALYLGHYYEVGKKPIKFESAMCTGYIIKMGLTCLIGFLLIFIAMSQMYFGAVSGYQAIFSVLLGFGYAILGHYKVRIHFKLIPATFAIQDDIDKVY